MHFFGLCNHGKQVIEVKQLSFSAVITSSFTFFSLFLPNTIWVSKAYFSQSNQFKQNQV